MVWASKFRHNILMNALLQVVSRRSATIGVPNEDVVPVGADHLQIADSRTRMMTDFKGSSMNARSWVLTYPKSIDVSD